MIKEIIETTGTDITAHTAWEVHCEVLAAKRQAALSIYEMARGLKRMRDEKLYEALGYSDFPNYCTSAAKVNATQAYKYIKVYEELGSTVLQSAGGMGIEKLYMVLSLPFDERNDALAEPEKIEGMSVSELREFIATAKGNIQQLSFLEEELAERDERIKELESEQSGENADKTEGFSKDMERLIAEYEEKLKEAERKSALDMANYRESVKKEHERAIEAEKANVSRKYKDKIAGLEREHAEALSKAKENAASELRNGIADEARKKAEAAVKEEIETLKTAVSDLEKGRGELERKLKLSDSAIITFKLYLTGMQENFNRLVEFVAGLDGDQSKNCKAALGKVMEQLNEATKKVIGNEG